MEKFSLVQTQQGNFNLMKGLRACDCPFQPAVIVPSAMGSMAITRLSCNSDCALMKIQPSMEKTKAVVELKCTKDFTIVNVEIVDGNNSNGAGLKIHVG